MNPETLLELKNVSVHYGGVKALDGASMSIDEGEVVAVMGPNGAGKSTVLKSIFGIAPISDGSVMWRGRKVDPVPHQMVERGIAFVPQGRRVFKHLTVRENLEIGGYVLRDRKLLRQRVEDALALFPALRAKLGAKSGSLSGGQQQMLAIARGLVVDPKVLLLDEPTLGLAPKVVKEVFEKVREIGDKRKIAIVIVEHNLKSMLTVAHRGYVLSHGKVIAADKADALVSSGILEKAFVGKA